MNSYVIDAYAWIEYFEGSGMGEKVRDIVEDRKNSVHTNILTFAELSSHYRKKSFDFTLPKKKILSLSHVFSGDISFCVEAGVLHTDIRKKRKHMGMADVFVLLTARKVKGKVVTGDEDFRGLREVIMIK